MKIEWYEKDVYGKSLRYVKDPKISASLEVLLSQKTISETYMILITDLFNVEWVQVLPPKKD